MITRLLLYSLYYAGESYRKRKNIKFKHSMITLLLFSPTPLGWGKLSSGGADPYKLMQVSVPIVSRDKCENSYPGQIHKSMVCAGYDKGGRDSCQNDSGGPLVCEQYGRYYLEGVVSWGHGCADRLKYGVYANVRYLRRWINKNM